MRCPPPTLGPVSQRTLDRPCLFYPDSSGWLLNAAVMRARGASVAMRSDIAQQLNSSRIVGRAAVADGVESRPWLLLI